MANWQGHIGGGIASAVVFVGVLSLVPVTAMAQTVGLLHNWQLLAGIVVISVLFALFPDVDTNSKAQDIFFGIAFLVDVLLVLAGNFELAAYLGLLAMLPVLGHHRGWTHRKLAAVVVPLPILVVPYLYDSKTLGVGVIFYAAAVAGYFSHLLFDGLVFRHFRIKN